MSVLYGTSQGSSVSDTAPNDVKIDRCSWCFCPTAHTRVTQAGFWLARAVHRCGGCARRTLPCRKTGCEAFARGHPDGVDDEFCVVHASAFPRWPDATPGASSLDARYAAEVRELMEPKGRCSWCLDNKRHFLKQWRNDGNHSYAAEVRDHRAKRTVFLVSRQQKTLPYEMEKRFSETLVCVFRMRSSDQAMRTRRVFVLRQSGRRNLRRVSRFGV